jgi:hypothetical protein
MRDGHGKGHGASPHIGHDVAIADRAEAAEEEGEKRLTIAFLLQRTSPSWGWTAGKGPHNAAHHGTQSEASALGGALASGALYQG